MKKVKSWESWKGKRIGLLTNQSAFGFKGKYHWEVLQKELGLSVLFLPEHGLFAELQDQVSGEGLTYYFGSLKIENLYGNDEVSLVPRREVLCNLDLVVIDIRDVGSRYYTFLTTAFYTLKAIHECNRDLGTKIEILVINSPNPIGGKVEGSPLQAPYSSFVGVTGVVHRHGLTPAGLLSYYKETFNFGVNIFYIPSGEVHPKKYKESMWVPPSPNIPLQRTCLVYPGQCLLEGTNLSEGRGTTRPFETFGAPYLKGKAKEELDRRLANHQKKEKSLRPLRFLPTFHKHQGVICEGYQLFVEEPKKFHSLYFTLFFLRQTKALFPEEFDFLRGVYEFKSDLPAIQLLAGDSLLLDYLDGKETEQNLQDYLLQEETLWEKKTKSYQKIF